MKHRIELPKLWEDLGYKKGVEVGTKEGHNAKNIIDNYSGALVCVDIWTDANDYKQALENLKNERVVIFKESSVVASEKFMDNSLDFVYIDADHSYEAVKADYEAWLPKIRKGGMISGHDYGLNGDCEGVKQFIDEMISKGEVYEFTTDDFFEGRPYQSWYKIVK